MVKVSKKSSLMPASAIRKLVPFADAAQNDGIKVYHLNVGAPDIKSPECALEAVRKNTLDHVSYTNSAGLPELRKGLAEKYHARKPSSSATPATRPEHCTRKRICSRSEK